MHLHAKHDIHTAVLCIRLSVCPPDTGEHSGIVSECLNMSNIFTGW